MRFLPFPITVPVFQTSMEARPMGGVSPSQMYAFCISPTAAVPSSNAANRNHAVLGSQWPATASSAALSLVSILKQEGSNRHKIPSL